MSSIIETSFKLTSNEVLCSAAATICLQGLERRECPVQSIAETCFAPQYGFTASASPIPSGPRFVRITDIQEGLIDWNSVPFCDCVNPDSYRLQTNDILIARAGSIGKSFIISDMPEPAIFASYMIRLRAKPNFSPMYLYWCLQSRQFWQQIMNAQRGSAMKNINGQMISSLRFPVPSLQVQEAISLFLEGFRNHLKGLVLDIPLLPPFLQKQRHIIVWIKELAAKIEEARGLRREAVEEVKAVYDSATVMLLRPFSKIQQARIEDVAEVRGGIQKGPHRIPGSNPVRYLTVAHVLRNKISLADPRFFEVSAEELGRWMLKSGDVLIIEGNGSADQVGRTALFRGEIDRCVHQNHVIRIRPDQRRTDPEFLNIYLNSPIGQEEVQSRSRTTSGLRNLSVGRIKQISIAAPPLSEQRRIVIYLNNLQSKVDTLKRVQAETSLELDALLPSILDKAFKGEL